MTRKIVSRDELNEILTEELGSCEGCEGTKVTVLYDLAEPDDMGCNWSADVSLRLGNGVDKEHASLLATAIVQKNRLLFNLT
jgi:hypothetical protein